MPPLRSALRNFLIIIFTGSFIIYASDNSITDHNSLLLDTLENIVLSNNKNEVSNCPLVLFSNTTNTTAVNLEEELFISSIGSRIEQHYVPLIQMNNGICQNIQKFYNYCNLNRMLPKATCFTFLIFLTPAAVENASISTVANFITTLLRPSNVNRGKYIFFTTGNASSKPQFLSDSSLDYFKNKIEITQSMNRKGEARTLLYTYSSLNSKSYILVGAYSTKTGMTIYGENMFPDLTQQSSRTTEFTFNLVQAKLQKTLSSNKALEKYLNHNPLMHFIENLAETYNWTLGDSYYEAITMYRGGYVDRLQHLKIAIGINFIVDRITAQLIEISPTYNFVTLCYLEKKEQRVITSWDSLAHILRTTYPGYSYFIITGIICLYVAFTTQLGSWIIHNSCCVRKNLWKRLKLFL